MITDASTIHDLAAALDSRGLDIRGVTRGPLAYTCSLKLRKGQGALLGATGTGFTVAEAIQDAMAGWDRWMEYQAKQANR